MPTWNYIIVILCLLLLAFMCWNEWRRVNRSRLTVRLVASIVAVVTFACLALPLSRKIKATSVMGKPAVLLTEGFIKDSVNNYFLKNNSPAVYTLDKNIVTASKNYKVQLLTADELALLEKQVPAFHVFGYGLEKEDLQMLQSSSIIFHPAKLLDGITSVNWQHKIKTGDRLRVQGDFLNSSAKEMKVIFSGYGVDLDTVIIPANNNRSFELSAVPKQLGRAVYTLTAIAGTDTVEKELVPFEIEQPHNLKILILAASPDFENKFLKGWLSQHEYALVTRTTISTNKYEKTFLNTAQVSFTNITSSFLRDFDLLIADVGELTAVSKSELSAIESQVSQKGMGLIVKGDSATAKAYFYSRPFPVLQHADSNHKDISVYIPVSNQYATAFTTEHQAYIRSLPGTKSLVEDKQSNIIVSSTIYGAGKLIYTTLNSTFSWMLSGDNKTYQTYWSYLLEQAIAKTNAEKSWGITPAYPQVNRAVTITYYNNNPEMPQAQVGKDFVHLGQNPDLPFQWQGSYWPQHAGWQPIMQPGSDTFWWYAYDTNNWKPMTVSQKIKESLQFVSVDADDGHKDLIKNELITVPISKTYFFVMFLCCVCFLWIEKKL